MLHIINKSLQSPHNRQLELINTSHTLVLLEDGVYAALNESESAITLSKKCNDCLVLKADVSARALSQRLHPSFKQIDYEDLVDLTLTHKQVISW